MKIRKTSQSVELTELERKRTGVTLKLCMAFDAVAYVVVCGTQHEFFNNLGSALGYISEMLTTEENKALIAAL